MSARWESVIEDLIALRGQLVSSPASAFAGLPESDWLTERWRSAANEIAVHAKGAEPVYVSGEIVDVLDLAVSEFKPEALHESDVFARRAFAVFPDGFTRLLPDGEEWVASEPGAKGHRFNAMLWSADSRGVDITVLRRTSDMFAAAGASQRPPSGVPWQIVGSAFTRWGDVPTDEWTPVQAFWRIAASVVCAKEPTSRGSRRRLERANIHFNGMTVIRLRRAEYPRNEESERIDWSCRWIVRGHWRTLSTGKQIFIAPYVKGPDDKPLRITDRVFEFVR